MGAFFDEYKREVNRLSNGPAGTQALNEANRALQTSVRVIDTTLRASQSVGNNLPMQVTVRMSRSAAGLRSVSNAVSRTQSLNEGAADLARITAAARALNRMNRSGGTIRDHPEDAARLFGKLFVSTGRLAEYLPPPANTFAAFLQGAGSFFTNMRNIMDLENAYHGQMRIANDAYNNLYTNQRGTHPLGHR